MTRRVLDLSHPLEAGMVTYPGLPGPEIGDHLRREDSAARYAPDTTFQIGWIRMVANTGTYLDTPFHRYADGADLAAAPLTAMVDLDTVVVPATADRAIGPDAWADAGDLTGRAVLLRTGWDRHWRTDAYGDPSHPFLAEDGARALVAAGAALVGIDSVNIDDIADTRRPAHSVLLAAGIPVVEHLCALDAVPATGARLHAAPPAVVGMGTFPVRVYALVDS